jgi:hypothetical protein
MIPINYLAVLAAAAFSVVLGFTWYGPLFGKIWMKTMGVTKDSITKEKMKEMNKNYVLMMLGTLLIAFTLSHVIVFSSAYFKYETVTTGLMSGFWIWLGFFAPLQMDEILWGGRPWKLFFINTSYRLVALLGMGVILAVWR